MAKQKQDPQVEWGFHAVVPRLIRTGYEKLTPVQKWLYVCLKDLCGEHGTCYRALRVLAQETGISLGMLSESVRSLHDVGLIHAEKKRRSTNPTAKEVWHITIVDIWRANAKEHPTKRSQNEQSEGYNVHTVNNNVQQVNKDAQKRSAGEQKRSLCETEAVSLSSINNEAVSLEEGRSLSPESDVPAPIDFKTESAKLKAVSLQIVTDYEKDSEALVIPPRLTLKQKEQSVDSGTSVQHSGASPGPSPTRAGAAQEEEKPPMALTAKQIKAQADKREVQLWAIIEAERNTKYTTRHREMYENKEGINCLIADDISDEDLRTGLQALDAFQSKSFTVLKFYGWLPNLSARAPTPMTNGVAPRKNFTGMGRLLKAN